jgi:hypothetical protein
MTFDAVCVFGLTFDFFFKFASAYCDYKGALSQKKSFLVICTNFRSDSHVD